MSKSKSVIHPKRRKLIRRKIPYIPFSERKGHYSRFENHSEP